MAPGHIATRTQGESCIVHVDRNRDHFDGVQPVEHRLVPQLGVLWLQHPVILVGSVDQPRRHSLPQRVVARQSLRDGHAIVWSSPRKLETELRGYWVLAASNST